MSNENGATRWWENYLVRYLMPSIAGAAIVAWLTDIAGHDLKALLLMELGNGGLQTPTLLTVFLYGNLFCYIASYPILGFHVTRVIDFHGDANSNIFLNGYISTIMLGIIALVLSVIIIDPLVLKVFPFIFVTLFSLLQIIRIIYCLRRISHSSLSGKESKIFAYTYSLARRRGIAEELTITKQNTPDQKDEETGDKFDEESEWQKKTVWRKEFIDTYRHMREHGNSAFIFVLELILAAFCFCLLKAFWQESAEFKLSAIGILLSLWALPALSVHFLGQHIERRFSLYDKKTMNGRTGR